MHTASWRHYRSAGGNLTRKRFRCKKKKKIQGALRRHIMQVFILPRFVVTYWALAMQIYRVGWQVMRCGWHLERWARITSPGFKARCPSAPSDGHLHDYEWFFDRTRKSSASSSRWCSVCGKNKPDIVWRQIGPYRISLHNHIGCCAGTVSVISDISLFDAFPL